MVHTQGEAKISQGKLRQIRSQTRTSIPASSASDKNVLEIVANPHLACQLLRCGTQSGMPEGREMQTRTTSDHNTAKSSQVGHVTQHMSRQSVLDERACAL